MSASSESPLPDLGPAYEIVDVLGEGGMGTVYLARDLRHDRSVAVKTIRRDFVTPDVRRRFEREIRVTSSLQHPRILPLLDSGAAEDGSLFYVMQFIEGESLEERLQREGPLPIEDAVRIARHVSDALAYAHGRGVVHRDVKPANVMLSDGHAFVMDFGIARAVAEGGSSLTSTGSAIGTPRYMSPEQVADSTAVDGRSDIYSLGCVLYEMVAGQPPFVGPTVDSVLRQHLTADPPSLDVHRPGIPASLDGIVARTLAKTPADRFQSARELTEALQSLAAPGAFPAGGGSPLRTGAIVLAAYLAGGWGVVVLVERVVETAALPDWAAPFALVLLLIGFLVTAATTVVQTLGRSGGAGGTDPGITGGGRRAEPGGRRRLRRLFRWRNVVAGGVLALALWGVVAGYLIWSRSGDRASAGDAEELAAVSPAAASTGTTPVPGDTATTVERGEASTPLETGEEPGTTPASPPPSTDPGSPVRGAGARGAAPDSTAVVDALREEAGLARADAARRGARRVQTLDLAHADSLWDAASAAEAAGRPTEAAGGYVSAREAYAAAGAEARRIFETRLDSARSAIDTLRRRASPEHEGYAEGERLRAESRDLAVTGDPLGALAALEGASEAYTRALPFVELPSDYEEAAPAPAPTPEERIEAAMNALERACEAEDVDAIRRVWANLSPAQVEGFRGFFEDRSDIDYEYAVEPGSIRVTAAGIEFRVSVRWEFEERGDVVSRRDELRFRLEATGDGDVLYSL